MGKQKGGADGGWDNRCQKSRRQVENNDKNSGRRGVAYYPVRVVVRVWGTAGDKIWRTGRRGIKRKRTVVARGGP